MRPVLFTAIAASALVASVALAQTPPPPPEGAPPPPPPPREMGYGGPGGYMQHYRRPVVMPPKAAVFRFRAGDRSVFVKCADDENTKACTDGVTAMMNAINPAQPANR